MAGRLEGKTAIVTGGGRGIGEAIVRAFVAEGAFTYIADLDRETGEALARELGESPTAFLHLDVRDEAQWKAAIAAILDARGRLDVLINNAGITGFEDGSTALDPEHETLDHWHKVHATNLDGVFLGCREAIAAMRRTGSGSIINMASRSGLGGVPGAVAYASSKAAVINHSKSVALYCAAQRLDIRCNAVAPGAILTPMWEGMLGDGPDRDARMGAMTADLPLQRFGTPEEVAALCVLLASDEAKYLTGAEIKIDGALTAGSAASPSKDDD
jgi:NAD(P)-dependent dehydrogenase (short-subunit alcohol dehydrogenase family)